MQISAVISVYEHVYFNLYNMIKEHNNIITEHFQTGIAVLSNVEFIYHTSL